MPTSQRVLVTGGAGFIGSHLTWALVAQGAEVRVVDNLSTGRRSNLAPIESEIDLRIADLRDPEVCRRAVAGVDIVYHVAALPSVPRSMADPVTTHECNVTATLHLLEACRQAGVQRVVYSSSSSVYGETPVLPKVEDVEPLPRSPYATSKLAGEQYVLAYARAGLVEGVALRYFNVFGPRQDPDGPYAAVIPLMMRAALSDTPMVIFGDGRQTRDFTYIENVVRANLLAASAPAAQSNGWVTNLGAGERTSLLALVELIEEISERRISVEHRPPRAGDIRDSLAGLDRARQVLDYVPVVSMREGLRLTWEAALLEAASSRSGATT